MKIKDIFNNKKQLIIVLAPVVILLILYFTVLNNGQEKEQENKSSYNVVDIPKIEKDESDINLIKQRLYRAKMESKEKMTNGSKEDKFYEVSDEIDTTSTEGAEVKAIYSANENDQVNAPQKTNNATAVNKSSGSKKKIYKSQSSTKPATQKKETSSNKTSDSDLFPTIFLGEDSGERKDESSAAKSNSPRSIKKYKAEIYGTQEITDKSAVEIRVLTTIPYDGLDIHYNSRLYGIAVLNNGRYKININSVKTSKGEYAVKMKVLDNDGLEGLFYKSDVEKNLERDKDNLISRTARSSGTTSGDIISETSEIINESIIKEGLKPLKKKDYSIYVVRVN